MSVALFVAFVVAGMAAVIAPLARRPIAWPADPPDERDDLARAVSSLRDLEFARAAGTIAPSDYARLRGMLERDAFVRRSDEPRSTAPVRTLLAAALIAGVVAGVVAVTLPRSAGDRAPGETVTGTVPRSNDLAALEARAQSLPTDIPTQLALADAYVQAGRPLDAVPRYQAVLTRDPNNVAALDGLALILVASGSNDGAITAADRTSRDVARVTGEGDGCFGTREVGDDAVRFGADPSVAGAAGCAASLAFPRDAFDC